MEYKYPLFALLTPFVILFIGISLFMWDIRRETFEVKSGNSTYICSKK